MKKSDDKAMDLAVIFGGGGKKKSRPHDMEDMSEDDMEDVEETEEDDSEFRDLAAEALGVAPDDPRIDALKGAISACKY